MYAVLELPSVDYIIISLRWLPSRVDDKEIPSESKIPPEPIQPRFIPWHVRQQMLEKEDRIAAKLMREKVEEMNPVVEQLEKELGVSDAK